MQNDKTSLSYYRERFGYFLTRCTIEKVCLLDIIPHKQFEGDMANVS